LFFHVSRGGIGIEPFYGDIRGLLPATVTHFRGPQVDSLPYLDWGELLETRPITPGAAEESFVGIASEYLNAVLHGRDKVACLLSGGGDSALMAWLLDRIGKKVVCLTADYEWKRYSEFSEAARNAADLGLKPERVLITRRNHYAAFRSLNSVHGNAPCGHSQSPGLYWLARHAAEQGIDRLITGDHADALFLGFDPLFQGFPQDLGGYSKAVSELLPEQKLARLYFKPQIPSAQREVLSAFGYSTQQCHEWQTERYTEDSRIMAQWAPSAPLPTLQQIQGQIWAGISWQNIFLAVTQSLPGQIEFISPFYDIEMIKFALSLPIEYKYKDGATKALLRTMVHRVLKRSIVKRASPSPNRLWSLLPSLQHRRSMLPRLRPVYDHLCLRNLAHSGRLSSEVDKAAALGIWLASQRIGL
jgi:asparagine synthetase B (glutamine-hydrolysing)